MTGPYSASIVIDLQPAVVFDEAELREGSAVAHRFYQDATPALVEGATRSAVFVTAALLEDGQQAEVEIHGFVAGKPTLVRREQCRREHGKFITTLGCRFNERIFLGV